MGDKHVLAVIINVQNAYWSTYYIQCPVLNTFVSTIFLLTQHLLPTLLTSMHVLCQYLIIKRTNCNNFIHS